MSSTSHQPHSSALRLPRSASAPSLRPPQISSKSLQKRPQRTPYPVSYQRSALKCDALDNQILSNLRKSSSLVSFASRSRPSRCLDLGCGVGTWSVDAAKEWPHSHFIGFDIADIQPPPHLLPPQVANRIKWVHGNFLDPLPFKDSYFDHVHIRHIARGVPDHKWHHIIAEVRRVLTHGGTLEIFEEDIIFPILPRSFTANPRQRTRIRSTILYPSSPPSVTKYHLSKSLPSHDHAVLEVLFYRIFQCRSISLRPAPLIMHALNVHFPGATASPLINFPLPPPPPLLTGQPSRSLTSRPSRTGLRVAPRGPVPLTALEQDTAEGSSTGCGRLASDESTPATSLDGSEGGHPEGPSLAFYSDAGLPSPSGCDPSKILPQEKLAVTRGTLGINFYRSWQGVMACREAIWDEYCDAVQNDELLLTQIDWEEDELKLTDRQRFDALLKRYQVDMEARYSIAAALMADLHWAKPQVEESKEDAGERRAVAEARRDALRLERSGIGAVPEASKVCRKARLYVASKGRVRGFGVHTEDGNNGRGSS